MTQMIRVGLDLGGTKIAAIALNMAGTVVFERRIATPRDDYTQTIRALGALTQAAEAATAAYACVGIGIPGSISPHSGLVQNANSTWLNGKPLKADIETALARPVRLANDANCLAMSEAHDGAAAGAASVFAIILGTGCGGGMVINRALHQGHHSIAGEWGHTPLPWPDADEYPGPECWCGKTGCLETWLSGPGLSRDHHQITGATMTAEQIATAAANGDSAATKTLDRHVGRLARGVAAVLGIVDTDIVVIGGGLSAMAHLYERLPDLVARHVFTGHFTTDIRPAAHGDASGVRGAARLWAADECAGKDDPAMPRGTP